MKIKICPNSDILLRILIEDKILNTFDGTHCFQKTSRLEVIDWFMKSHENTKLRKSNFFLMSLIENNI